jgi:hypothetical protein
MHPKLEEFVRETMDAMLLQKLTAEQRLEGLPAEERVKGLSADEILRALSPETLEDLRHKLKANGTSPKSA